MAVHEPGIMDLIRGALSGAQDLVRSEVALAKRELRQEVSRLQIGVGAFAAAAVAAIIGVVMLLATVAWAIAEGFGWPVWAGFGIVTLLTLIGAIALFYIGRRHFAARQPMPLTIETMKETTTWMRARTS